MKSTNKTLSLEGYSVAVTGASSGLGRAIALCRAGSYLAKPILIGRREGELKALKTEIERRFGVISDVLVADQCCLAGREQIASKIEQLSAVAIFLCAGVTSVGPFCEDSDDTYARVINTNIVSFTDLLARFIRVFHKLDRDAGILAISSLAGSTSLPDQAVYGASKAYIDNLVQALDVELSYGPISIGTFRPGGIDTPMADKSDLRFGKLGLMNVDECAALAVRALVHRKRISIPGWANTLGHKLISA